LKSIFSFRRKTLYFDGILNQHTASENMIALLRQLSKSYYFFKRIKVESRLLEPYSLGPLQRTSTELTRTRLHTENVDFIRMSSLQDEVVWQKKILDPRRYVLVQTPYLKATYEPSIDQALRNSNVIYQNYGVNLADTPEMHYQLAEYKLMRFINVSFPEEIDFFVERGIQKDRLILTGNPLIWEVYKRSRMRSRFQRGTGKILWSPHWTRQWSNLESIVEPMYHYFLNHPLMTLTINAHPFTYDITGHDMTHFQDAYSIENANTKSTLNALLKLPNVNITRGNLVEDILNHDHLITDGVSIIAYWAITGKDLTILRRSNSPRLSTLFYKYFHNLPNVQMLEQSDLSTESQLQNLFSSSSTGLIRKEKPHSIGIYEDSPGALMLRGICKQFDI
jgi:hypothetical protein